MAWTASITSIEQVKGDAIARVSYADGAKSFVESYVITSKELLEKIIANRVAQLTAAATEAAKISTGAVSITPVVEEPPETPVVDQQKLDFLAAYRKVVALKKAIDLGITTDQDAAYVAALKAAKDNYDADYLGNP